MFLEASIKSAGDRRNSVVPLGEIGCQWLGAGTVSGTAQRAGVAASIAMTPSEATP